MRRRALEAPGPEFELAGWSIDAAARRWLARVPLPAVDKLAEPVPEDARTIAIDNTVDVLAGKKVMIVDDDMRNIFALTSTLERHDIVTVSAETGRDAINLLQAAPDVDIVLMDIMMPEMDGIDTMSAIRRSRTSRACRSSPSRPRP